MSDPTTPKQDVTHQSLRLARILDRLQNGTYMLQIEKKDRDDTWDLCIWDDTGKTVRDTELRRWD